MREGQEIGSYVLESPLGKGGMGEVFLARHKSLGRRAAIKVLAVAVDEPQFHERFSREARAQAQLSHPNVARVLDHVQKDGRWYLITEYMPRGTLKDVLDQGPGPVPPAQALAWTRQALRGLEYAHRQGIVHRDVKPANVLVNEHGEAAVTDFGLAMVAGGERLTQTGTALGTPAYMSPEQVSGDREVDHRTDVYSMGVVLYELLTGRVPFPMKSASEVVRVLVNEPPPLREVNPSLPPELEGLVMRALAKNPDARYADCKEFAEAVGRCERGEAVAAPPPLPPPLPPEPTVVVSPAAQLTPPPQARRTSPWAVAAILAILAIGGLGLAAAAVYYVLPTFLGDAEAGTTPPESKGEGGAEPLPIGTADGAMDGPEPVALGAADETSPAEPGAGQVVGSRELLSFADGAQESDLSDLSDLSDSSDRVEQPEIAEVLPPPPLPPPPLPPPPPPPPPPLLPARPVVAVVAFGDPLFAGAFEAELEDRLRGAGFDVADERNSLRLADLLRRWGDDVAVPEILPLLEDEGFHVVVVAQVEVVGYRELQYLGRYSQATQARLRLNAYLVGEGSAMGPGWSEAVEYTELNAAGKAETAMLGASGSLSEAIHQGWRAYRRR
jgi:serine/threonine-protein kinase